MTRPTITKETGGTTSSTTPSTAWSWPLSLVPTRSRTPRRLSQKRTTGPAGQRTCSSPATNTRPTRRRSVESTALPRSPRPLSGPGRPPVMPERQIPTELKYATVHKVREKGRVVEILTAVVMGTWAAVAGALERSSASRAINTSFVERHHLTDRHHNARKSRKTYRFSKDWRMHEVMTYFTKYSDNFCWPVRTLREPVDDGRYRQRTPAMAAGLTDHVWLIKEWLSFPAVQQV
jgi:hypothetical protein